VASAALLGADVISKNAAIADLSGLPKLDVIQGLLSFQLLYNSGAAFSTMQGMSIPLATFAVIVLIIVLAYTLAVRKHSIPELVGLSLFAAGVAGNAVDRLQHGVVVDFLHLDFIQFPTFNLADVFITCGALLLIIIVLVSLIRGLNKSA
jgi:signal peptidase II